MPPAQTRVSFCWKDRARLARSTDCRCKTAVNKRKSWLETAPPCSARQIGR
ncbi:hypothetical protein XAPC_392 [Xanthomonas citri pv. punicae str. LMG 859]|nr:hypothetical protein XAPC_392 [Xanthomonas citri pv. punicae str. LMG 859]